MNETKLCYCDIKEYKNKSKHITFKTNVQKEFEFNDKLQAYFGEKNSQCHYMNSVTKDTPIILKKK